MTTSSGMKTIELAAMPFCTPRAMTTMTASHTMTREIRTAGTTSKEIVASAPPRAWVYSPKKPSGSSPQR